MVALYFNVAEERANRRAEYQRIRGLLRDLSITVFDTWCPLAVGIREPLVELLAGEVEPYAVARFLRRHTSQIPYCKAIARGEPRRDLNGAEVGPPTEEQRKFAAKRLAWIERRRAAKRAEAV